MLAKLEIKNLVQNFCAMSQRQFDKPVRMVWSDNGMEFMPLTGYFCEMGTVHQTSYADTPQQNGRVERKH